MEFYIHRGLICHLSAPLNAMLKGSQESLEGCVTWEDVNSDVFSRFAQFLYTGAYTRPALPENASPSTTGTSQTEPTHHTKPLEQVVSHAQTWVLADKYAIDLLKDLAYSFLADDLARWTISPSAFIPDFGRLVRYVYSIRTIGGQQLRRLVAQFAAHVVKDVPSLDDWETLLEVPGFAVDLIEQIVMRIRQSEV